MSSGGKPIVEPIILSEYLNRYYRIEWEVGFKSRYHSFKKFRKSLDFKSIASSAERYARAILQHSRVISSSLDAQDIETAVRSVGIGEVDFNDALIISICKKHNFKLMTHDADFHSAGIEILTTNTRLLPRC